MSCIPCVSLANATTPVTNLSGGGGSNNPNPSFTTITLNPTSGTDAVAININADPNNGNGGYIGFIRNGYEASIGTDNVANLFIANGSQGQYGSGVMNFIAYSTITMKGGFPNVTPSTILSVDDIVCGTINGSAPKVTVGAGGNVYQLVLPAGTSSNTYALPSLSAQGYYWSCVITPNTPSTLLPWANPQGDILTWGVANGPVGSNTTYNLVAVATKV